ncbi:MAG: hypothetical protein RJB60_2387 [Pseudomonadota bacterium]|jgi:hypothetical protein
MLNQYTDAIRTLADAELNDAAALSRRFTIARDGNIEVQYAPFEFINSQARVVLVGITPGRTQMVNALRECRRQLQAGAFADAALKAAKQTGAFSGAMRPNLIALMDTIGLNRWLGLSSCEALFGSASHLVQTTSVLRNPVFINGENYNGTPRMTANPLLRQQLLEGFAQDARALPKAVFLPLGDKVCEGLHWLADQGAMDRTRILDGLPHPSGANAERIAYFLGRKAKGDLSAKTSPGKLDEAKAQLIKRVLAL